MMRLVSTATATLVLVNLAVADDGRGLYLEHCASCHGVRLEGQPDWRVRKPDGRLPAPPHDSSGHTWHHSDRALARIVRDGLQTFAPGYETDMPAFRDRLTDVEITSIIEFLKESWPERERAYQRARTEVDP
jgi:mono/diheme cytochrome c family protein